MTTGASARQNSTDTKWIGAIAFIVGVVIGALSTVSIYSNRLVALEVRFDHIDRSLNLLQQQHAEVRSRAVP